MLKSFNNVKILHLEPTDVCQAECPACARETNPVFSKSLHHYVTVEILKSKLGDDVIRNLDKVYLCGNYGDPAAGLVHELFSYVRHVNPTITLGMNTNGALQSPDWWEKLAALLDNPTDYVVFSIDGLENTNDIYRKNVSWNRLMRNVETYINAGGNAHWDMLVFKHNEHQVEDCEKLAKQLGFKWFRAKVSKREFYGNTEHPINWIRPVATGPIECRALANNEIFMDSLGNISPCCWLGETDPTADFTQVQASWGTQTPHITCSQICSTSNNQSNFTSQWQKIVEF